MLELVFGMADVAIFYGCVETARDHIAGRVDHLRSELRRSTASGPRASYKSGQLDRIAASLRRQDTDKLTDRKL